MKSEIFLDRLNGAILATTREMCYRFIHNYTTSALYVLRLPVKLFTEAMGRTAKI